MDLGINGKRALVTGGSSGIGRACAIELAKEGARVCVTARDEDRLAQVVAEITSTGGQAFWVSGDLSDAAGCRKVMEACVQRWDGIDILVNVAGSAPRGHVLKDLSPAIIDDSLRLKMYGYLRLSQLAFPYMRKQRWGRIVNIAGAAASNPTPTNLAAGFANVGVLGITHALSDEGARDGILVNAICPGLTDTPRARSTRRAAAERAGRPMTDSEIEADIAREALATSAGRAAQPEEVARVVCFLASDACSYVHASALYMDGGGPRSGIGGQENPA
jgi:NAD(P)-dependent dehydrogenase (short-subunit alcohol dehydrogenase family)